MSAEVPKTVTPVSPAQMLDALGNAWITTNGTTPTRDQVAILLAQWALETGNGAKMICNNVGNARWFPGNASDYCQFMTWENVNGQHVNQIGKFRAFPTLEAGCSDYLTMMQKRFGMAWKAVLAGDVTQFVYLLKAERYFTADVSVYMAGVKARFSTFKNLPPASWETTTDAPVPMIETDPPDSDPPPEAA